MRGLVIKNTGSWYTVRTDDGRDIESKIKGNFRLKEMGFDSAKAFENRVYDYIERQNAANAAAPETEKE